MTVAPPPSRLQIAQRLALHFSNRDFEQVIGLLSPDVVYQVEGNHALAGTFHGPDAVAAHLSDLAARTNDTYEAYKWEDWLVGEHHVAALVRIHAQGHRATYSARLLTLLRFDMADKVSEIMVFFEDVHAAERFFGK